MYYVYALSSTTRNYIYVGLTDNIQRRINQHNAGKSKTTKPYRPFVLIYSETFETRLEARAREKYLVDALDSKSSSRKGVRVRFPPSVLFQIAL